MGILQTAVDLIGEVDYVFGATDIAGGRGDCSAFTQYVFAQNGVTLERNTFGQIGQGNVILQKFFQHGSGGRRGHRCRY